MMRCDRLSRKTTLKRIDALRPAGNICLYDFTATDIRDASFYELSEFLEIIPDGFAEDWFSEDVAESEREGSHAFTRERDILEWCAAILRRSPVALALYHKAAESGWSAGFGQLNGNGFHLNMDDKYIVLDHFSMTPALLGRSAYLRNVTLITLVRALRDIWHDNHHTPFEQDYAPEDILALERLRAADCDSVTILTAWELRGAGYGQIWRHMIGSAEGDMAIIFSRVLERDPAAFLNGRALAYALRQWYADDTRVNACDHETLEALDNIVAQSESCNPFDSRYLSEDKIESIGILPDGRNYLAGMGGTIKDDPFFAGLKDDINQCHLSQLLYDMQVTIMGNVPFRDKALAAMIFPIETEGEYH